MTIEQKLTRLSNRATAYEVVLERGEDRRLVRYTTRHSISGMMNVVRDGAGKIAAAVGIDLDRLYVEREGNGTRSRLKIDGGWTIRFSGRTQREAIVNGELPFIGVDGKAR